MVRPIRALESTSLVGTENGEAINSPAFSPDGKSLAFYAIGEQAIKRIAVTGGGAVKLCAANNPIGLIWDASGIVFGQAESRQVLRVSACLWQIGGTPDAARGRNSRRATDVAGR